MNSLEKYYNSLHQQFEALNGQFFGKIYEGVDFAEVEDMSDLYGKLETLAKMFDGARRGLGIVNTLTAGEYKVKHARQVMTNLNKIRGYLQLVTREMEGRIK